MGAIVTIDGQVDNNDPKIIGAFAITGLPRRTGTFNCGEPRTIDPHYGLTGNGISTIGLGTTKISPPTFTASGAGECSVTVTKFVRGDGNDFGKTGDPIEGIFTVTLNNYGGRNIRIVNASFSVTAPSDGLDPDRHVRPMGSI